MIMSKVDHIDAAKDAMLLVDAYHHLNKRDALLIRIKYLVKAGLVQRAANLIHYGNEKGLDSIVDLELRDKIAICTNVIYWQMELIEYTYERDPNNWLDKNINFMDSLLAFSEVLKGLDVSKRYRGLEYNDVLNIVTIAKRYKLVVTASQYRSENFKLGLLKTFILNVLQDPGFQGLSGVKNADIVQYDIFSN